MDALAVVTSVVEGLAEVMWAARPPQELLDTVTAIERLRSVMDAVELSVVAEVQATNAAAAEGWGSTKDWLTAVTGGPVGEGRRLLTFARALSTDQQRTGAALTSGVISRVQAEPVLHTIDRLPRNLALRQAAEALLLEEAGVRNATELSRLGPYVLERLDPDGTERRDEAALEREERAAHHGRFLSVTPDGMGGVRVRGRGTVEDGAHLTTMLASLSAPQPTGAPGECGGVPGSARSCGVVDCAHDGRDPREHGARVWDALIEAMRRLEGTGVLPLAHGARPRVCVTIDVQALRGGLGEGLVDGGWSLSAAALRVLACDAEVIPVVLGPRSEVLDMGRASRLVTPPQWRALVVRDGHCAFPGCRRPPVACDAHHVVHWADGRGSALDNLVLLCRTHHTMVHSTPWEVRLSSADRRPEFLPPARLDPHRRPRRQLPLRPLRR